MKRMSVVLVVLVVYFCATRVMAQEENEWRFPLTFELGIGLPGHAVESAKDFPDHMRVIGDSLAVVPNDNLKFSPHINATLGVSWGPRIEVGDLTLSVRIGGFYFWDLAYVRNIPQSVRLGEPDSDGRRSFCALRYKGNISFPVYQAELEIKLFETVEGPKINWVLGYTDLSREFQVVKGWNQGKSLDIVDEFDVAIYRMVVLYGGLSITGERVRYRIKGGFSGILDHQEIIKDLVVNRRNINFFFCFGVEVDTRSPY